LCSRLSASSLDWNKNDFKGSKPAREIPTSALAYSAKDILDRGIALNERVPESTDSRHLRDEENGPA
jgi:hypothetical protein